MIDTHAHLSDTSFHDELGGILQRAQVTGIERIICVSENAEDFATVRKLGQEHRPLVATGLGLHPCYVSCLSQETISQTLETFESLASEYHHTLSAIAEVGLDLTPHVLFSSPDAEKMQQEAFKTAMKTASQFNLPMSIHSRGAGRRSLEQIIQTQKETRLNTIIMHAFDGRPIHAERALKEMPNGLYFSMPPSIVRSDGLKKLVRRLPMEKILVESDAPALPAVKGQRNEPAEIVKTISAIATERGLETKEVRQIIENNERVALPRLISHV